MRIGAIRVCVCGGVVVLILGRQYIAGFVVGEPDRSIDSLLVVVRYDARQSATCVEARSKIRFIMLRNAGRCRNRRFIILESLPEQDIGLTILDDFLRRKADKIIGGSLTIRSKSCVFVKELSVSDGSTVAGSVQPCGMLAVIVIPLT